MPTRKVSSDDRMERNSLIRAINLMKPLLERADRDWCIYGSCALELNGVPGVEAHDVDIVMSARGARLLSECLGEPDKADDGKRGGHLPREEKAEDETGHGQRFRSLHRKTTVLGIEFDISGGLEVKTGSGWIPVQINEVREAGGIRFASLHDCARLLLLFGRPKDFRRLKVLEEWASRQGITLPTATTPPRP